MGFTPCLYLSATFLYDSLTYGDIIYYSINVRDWSQSSLVESCFYSVFFATILWWNKAV